MSSTAVSFKPVQKRRAAEHVAQQIRGQILAGAFAAGQRLPPERELAVTFGINRTTVREALRSLEQQRLIDIHHGDGATVLDIARSAGLELLTYLVQVDGQMDLSLLGQILEARRLLGVEMARLAAQRATAEQLQALAGTVEQLAQHADDPARFQELDWLFFEQLSAAAHNRVYSLILNTVRPIYFEHRDLFAAIYQDRAELLRLHRQTLDRLRARDARGAAGSVAQYLDQSAFGFGAPAPEADPVGTQPNGPVSPAGAALPPATPPKQEAGSPSAAGTREATPAPAASVQGAPASTQAAPAETGHLSPAAASPGPSGSRAALPRKDPPAGPAAAPVKPTPRNTQSWMEFGA